MPEGVKTGDAIKEDAGALKQKGADAIGSASGNVEEAAGNLKKAIQPEEPTMFEKAKDKVSDAYDSVKKATVG